MRNSDRFFVFLLGALCVLALECLHCRYRGRELDSEVQATAAMVRLLGLTDLSLFTDARYARHPSQADRFAPFQDHPASLEHFPSGSFTPPLSR